MADLEDVRRICAPLPRAYEAMVRDYVKFRVKQIVFASVSPDEQRLGFGYPKHARDALVAAEPDKFLLPRTSDLRYNWVVGRLPVLDLDELEELLLDAWAMCVPKFLRREVLGDERDS